MKTPLLLAFFSTPLFAADAPAWVRTARSGAWSDAATWDGGKVPAANARVQVRPGHTVVFDIQTPSPLRIVHVAGTLTFAHDKDTRLDVGLLKVQPGEACSEDGFDCEAHVNPPDANKPRATLSVGTPERPIAANRSAIIRLTYLAGMDKETCPALVCCTGKMELHGAPLSRAWLKLGATAKAGDKAVTLSEPVTGWKKGDRVIFTGTLPRSTMRGRDGKNVFTEERTIAGIDGVQVTFEEPLKYEHRGEGEYRGEVANLGRNVVVESALTPSPSPKGRGEQEVRGHTMYHRYSQGSISYAEFRHLGKENVLGKYPIHYHLVGDTMRGSSVVGASIWDSHNRMLTIHGTNYLVVRDCVGYKSVGHGFFFEDGTEVFNVLDRCLAVQAFTGKPLPKQVLPFDGNEGAGYWWSNSLNTFTGNVSCENDRYGWRFEATPSSRLGMTMTVQQPDGSRKPVDIRTLPFVRFDGNESHHEGLYGVNLGEGVNRVGPDTRHPFVVTSLKSWGNHYAFRPQVPSLLVEDLKIWRASYGVYHPNYDNHVYKNVYIGETNTEPFNRGHDDHSVQYGVLTVDGLTFDGLHSYGMPAIQISDDNPTGKGATHIRGLKTTNWRRGRDASLINLGGGPRPDPSTEKGVPIIVHDWFGSGKHARVVSTRSKEFKNDGLKYQAVKDLTGDESRAVEVTDVPFPKLLDPVDDLPPTTVVTSIRAIGADQWQVRGTTADNGEVKSVVVNGQPAKAMRGNYAEWEITLSAKGNTLEVKAHAEDAAGNREPRPHVATASR